MKLSEVRDMMIYTDENDVRLVQSIASASTLISSLTGEIRQHILSKFPKDFFKSIYIDTAETIQAQGRNDKYNRNLNKLPYPNMAITPEISLDEPIGGMEKNPTLNSPNLFLRKDMRRNYKKLLLDPLNKYAIYYTSNYQTVNYNFRITTNKFVQNADLAMYIQSNFQEGFFQFLNNRYLNTEIPKTFIALISEILGYNLDDDDQLMALELDLISTSVLEDIVRKKVNLLTGKTGFFVNEKINPLVLVTDIEAPGSIIRNQMSEGEYTVSFRVQVSAWLPNAFILSINKNKFPEINQSTVEEILSNSGQEQDEGFYSLAISDVLVNRKDSAIFQLSAEGESSTFQEVFHTVFTYDISTKLSLLYLADYMKDDLIRTHAYMVSKNMITSDLVRITMYNRNGSLINEDISVDYDLLSVIVNLSSAQDISLSIYVNRLLFEAIQKAIQKDEFFFSQNALASVKIKFNDELLRVPVYSFINERDMYSTELNKSLRINTIYGIGYIGLEDDNGEEGYKICVAYDGENPVIKKLQILN
jgi:hypothetical protein